MEEEEEEVIKAYKELKALATDIKKMHHINFSKIQNFMKKI